MLSKSLIKLLSRQRRAWPVPALLLAGLVGGGCAAQADGPERDPAVVAMVDDTPITATTVAALLPAGDSGPPVYTTGTPDPRRTALDQAVRDELFAREAAARKLKVTPPSGVSLRAARIRALIDRERAAGGITAERVSDADARAWHAQRRHLFDDVSAMRVSWARIGDERLARDLLRQASGTDRPGFLALVRRYRGHGVRDTASAALDGDGKGADLFVGRVAFAVRQAGRTGLVAGEKGDWWLARVDGVRLVPRPWNAEFAYRIKTALAWEREQQRLGRLAAQLQRKWAVRVFTERLSAIRDPRERQ